MEWISCSPYRRIVIVKYPQLNAYHLLPFECLESPYLSAPDKHFLQQPTNHPFRYNYQANMSTFNVVRESRSFFCLSLSSPRAKEYHRFRHFLDLKSYILHIVSRAETETRRLVCKRIKAYFAHQREWPVIIMIRHQRHNYKHMEYLRLLSRNQNLPFLLFHVPLQLPIKIVLRSKRRVSLLFRCCNL